MDEPTESVSLVEQAYLRLRQEILTCILPPGQVVSERELAGRYDMSKTPVREALTQVCHDGLVQRLPGRGYMVAPVTIKDVRDLFDLRLVLEVAAAERAARHPSPALVSVLKTMANVSYSLTDPETQTSFLKTNRDFHLALAEAAENRRLVETLEKLLIEMDRLFYLGLRLRDSSEEMRQEHRQVVAAVERGDVEEVRETIARQILTSQDRILEAILKGDSRHVQVHG